MSIFSDGALHPGRDANDAWWIVVRRPEEWKTDPRPGGEDGARYDPSRMVLELAPHPLASGTLPPPAATTSDGTVYIVDSVRGCILRRRTCDPAPVELACCFDDPRAIAARDGWLYVVERGRDRVQVIEPDAPGGPRLVIALEVEDPIAIAVGDRRIYVATAAGAIQPFDRSFRRGPRFMANRPGATTPEIIAIATDGDDLVVVADAGWSRFARFDCRGGFVDEIGADEAPENMQDALALARFELEGTRVVGPIDGGIEQLAWHQVVVDAELPEGTSIEVQTWAADAIALPPPLLESTPSLPVVTPWAPDAPIALPAPMEPRRGEIARPVLSDTTAWECWRHAPYHRGASWTHRLVEGPDTTDTFVVPWDLARRLRTGDVIALDPETATIAALSASATSVIATGDRSAIYAAGTEVMLHERDGRAIDPARMTTLAGAEAIDLTSIANDGDGGDIDLPHAIAALLRRGDVVELVSGSRRVFVEIVAHIGITTTVTLTAAVTRDLRTTTLVLREPAGRMVVRRAEGWGRGLAAASKIIVTRQSGDTDELDVTWSDPDTHTVWTATAPDATWVSFSPAAPALPTDRGRFLWVKLRLRGARRHASDIAATATPTVRSLRVVAPRLSFLSYLPAVYSRRDDEDPSGALFLERFLALFEGRLTQIESRYELIAYALNPLAADDGWLEFVASWFDLVFDPSWPRARRAALLSQIFELYRIRGTPEGIVRFVEAYTGHRPQLIEGFQVRPRAGLVLGCAGVLGCAPLAGLDVAGATNEQLLASFAHRFTLVTYVDTDCDLAVAETTLRALVDAIKPAHVDVDLRVAVPRGRIGFESTVGLDFILGDDRSTPAALGTSTALGRPAPVLGVDAVVATSLGPSALAETAPPTIGDFSLR